MMALEYAVDSSGYSIEEKYFHDLVRDWVISLLVFLILLLSSYGVMLIFRRAPETDDFSASDKEDTVVYHVAFLICVFSLSSAFSCALLLPASVSSNEILLMYPDSYYLQWVNGSLVTKLWDLTYYFSRSLIFLLLPFIYLFTEAIGFIGMRQGVMARVYEVLAVMCLVSFVLLGLVFLGMAIIYPYEDLWLSDVWRFMDRLVTAIGFLFLLIATPIGYAVAFKSAARRSLPFINRRPTISSVPSPTHNSSTLPLSQDSNLTLSERSDLLVMEKELLLRRRRISARLNGESLQFSSHVNIDDPRLEAINTELSVLQKELKSKPKLLKLFFSWLLGHSRFLQHLSPLLSACLAFGLAVLSALSTFFSVCERILTSRITLATYDEQLRLGHESLSRLGIFGSTLDLILQASSATAALIGIYNLPIFKLILPRRGDTPMTGLILNCTLWVLLAQAFPSFSSCLGLTNFHLLSGFRSSANWLLVTASSSSTSWYQIYLVVAIDTCYIAFVVLQLVNSLTAPLVRDFVAFIVTRWERLRYQLNNTVQAAADIGQTRTRIPRRSSSLGENLITGEDSGDENTVETPLASESVVSSWESVIPSTSQSSDLQPSIVDLASSDSGSLL